MVSVAIFRLPINRHSKPVPRGEWNQQERKLAKKTARETILGVGDEVTDIPEEGTITTVIRRQCTDDERRQVLEKYTRQV